MLQYQYTDDSYGSRRNDAIKNKKKECNYMINYG